jgi:hypothetical protein
MTRARAIEWLKEIKIAYKYSEQEEAIAFAISVLEKLDEERIEKMLVGFRFPRKGIMRFPDRNVKHLASAIVKELVSES